MPIWLRKYTFSQLNEFYEKEAKAYDNASKGSNTQTAIDTDGKVNPQAFQQSNAVKNKPTYSTRASKK